MNLLLYKRMRKILRAWAILLLFQMGFANAGGVNVVVVLSENDGAYREYADVLASKLATKNITLSIIYADQTVSEADLVIAAGMKAAASAAKARPKALLAVLVPREGYVKLQSEYPEYFKDGASMQSAIYLDQPYKRQLALIAAALPEARSVAVLYTRPPGDINILRSLASGRKLNLHERAYTANFSLYSVLQDVLLSSNVLLALPEEEIYNTATIRNILLATYRNKVPLVGFSPAYVKAGALCAVYSTMPQIASQSAAIVLEHADSKTLPAAQYAREFEVAVNAQVARSLGITIRSAEKLHGEMEKSP